MLTSASNIELNGFLAAHETVSKPRALNLGLVVDGWKVVGFLGSGGTSEVYRVKCLNRIADAPIFAALKVLIREDGPSKKRFAREVELLRQQSGQLFLRFYGAGDWMGRPYLVTEILEPIDLPKGDAAVAEYILSVCKAVDGLHRKGIVHRDIKPSNIMRRSNGELVLIDLGLVKDNALSSDPEKDVSIVSGKLVAVGTPRFAAPEQMMGGEVTAAVDIHAIGRLADEAFESNPPRSWLPIIRRATSSIPGHRYASVLELMEDIRHRHRTRVIVSVLACLCGCLSILASIWGWWKTTGKEEFAWHAICENTSTNLVVKELAWERLVTNKVGNSTMIVPERAYRQVQKQADVAMVRLNGQTNEFARAIVLDASREYYIEGPGILSAKFKAKGGTVRVHLKKCFLFNRSAVPIDKANIRYVFEGGAYLNFTDQDELPRSVINAHIEEFDGAYDLIRFRGPMTKEALDRERETGNKALLDRGTKKIFKNLHFPCRFLPSGGKYVVETMRDSIYKKYGINPNRVPTNAEVELVAYCFDVSLQEAREILRHRTVASSNVEENKERCES